MAGGTAPDEEEKASIILGKLPECIQDKLIFSEFKCYKEVKRYLAEHIQRLRDLGIKRGGQLHAVHGDRLGGEGSPPELLAALSELPGSADVEDIIAVLRRFPNKQRTNPMGPRKCFNCGEPGHLAAACPKPKRPPGTAGGSGAGQAVGGQGQGDPQGGKPEHVTSAASRDI